MKNLQYNDLPETLKSKIKEEELLTAYSINNFKKVLIWIVNEELGKQEELEYSSEHNALLSLEERQKDAPCERVVSIPEMGVEILIYYSFELNTNVMYENYQIRPIGSTDVLANSSQIYYSPYKNSPEEVAKGVLDEYKFANTYKSFDRDEKINYWVGILYRLRRQAVESGCEEDVIFDDKLLKKMKEVDQDIEIILHLCLEKLAALEQIDESKLKKAFNKNMSDDLLC
ncbi:hypothetical protein ACFOEE_06520 [Pseudoalteromonas fenneropenaei]|uniref:Uncharacterized protein n=1 Tax=Pseudoalteromonas fenneropenaei TaxID=1737459 RepID=A0ABV7CHW6_9GAMM